MNSYDKLMNEIRALEATIDNLKEQRDDCILRDWLIKLGKYYIVWGFSSNEPIYVYHIISVKKDELIYRYASLTDKFVAKHILKSFGECGYRKWELLTRKEFEKMIEGFEDLDEEKTGVKE